PPSARPGSSRSRSARPSWAAWASSTSPRRSGEPMAQLVQQIGGHQWNVREMVLNAGIGQYLAQMAIPYMYFLPRTCDPYAQGTQAIVQGLQNMLAARGHRVPVDGWMGRATMDATRVDAGPRWR